MTKPTRSMHPRVFALLAVATALALGACSSSTPDESAASSAPAQAAAANEAAAQKELKLYQQMVAEHRDELAAPVGEEIVHKYPGTSAAAEVAKTLPRVQATAKSRSEHRRLSNLWYYQTADVQGLQHTASIYAEGHERSNQIRLVLRRHVKWGQSAYLFGSGKGFVCKGDCDIVMHFDGKREVWKGYLPPSGEPAMFIKHDKRFIAAMEKARVITMDVTTRDHGKETLKFEVGGFDPAKFKPLPKS